MNRTTLQYRSTGTAAIGPVGSQIPIPRRFPWELVIPKDTWYLMIPPFEGSADTCQRPRLRNHPSHRYRSGHSGPCPPESSHGHALIRPENGTGSIIWSSGPEGPGSQTINRKMITNNAKAHTQVVLSRPPHQYGPDLSYWSPAARGQQWSSTGPSRRRVDRADLIRLRDPAAPKGYWSALPRYDHQQMQRTHRSPPDQAHPGPSGQIDARESTARKQSSPRAAGIRPENGLGSIRPHDPLTPKEQWST